MTVIGILFEKRNVDDLGFPRTPDRPVELLGTHVRYPRSVKTTIGACGPDSLGGSATHVHTYRYTTSEICQLVFQAMGTLLIQQAGTPLL